jgi:membrane protease YdiL (CAAX protease family)
VRADQGTPRGFLDLSRGNPAGELAPDVLERGGGSERPRLLAEFIGLFLVIPALPALGLLPVSIIPVLVAIGLLCLAVLLYDPTFDRRRLGLGPRGEGGPAGVRPALRRIGACFLFGAAGLGAAVAAFDSASLFSLVRTRPEIWALIMVGYPLISVYPQEMIFRAFLFHRYERVFRSRAVTIAASALVFGYAHIVLGNTLAVILSLAGGLIFAYTYDRTRSTLLCAVEHALYGCFIFTIGLGSYFYHGTMVAAEAAAGAGPW